MKQRRQAVGEEDPKELIGSAVYAISANSNPIVQTRALFNLKILPDF